METMETTGADVSQLRTAYNVDTFTEDQLTSHTDPFQQFHSWFQEALESIPEPQAMCISTATRDGRPSSRMVLMKKYDQDGFRFYTNYLSRKGCELTDNPNACILFYWEKLHRQVRIEGKVQRLSEEESISYFSTRPRPSQASACASMQSTTVTSRRELEEKMQSILELYPKGTPIPKPDYWGGYVLVPDMFEFWHGQSSRLHDRIVFTKDEQTGIWERKRLSP
ncbi:pyridoxine/pyridoxamine 5'-phosphate oxidase-like [Halichondria panicea]|uniref:pyridoxine/pyridoxamine 5'-phosphate oxidase-like n=1 Tax=Halichondria panicea TaxID=6063 RepID=UPI00312B62DB